MRLIEVNKVMREKEGFRENLERINAAFPDKEMLNVSEVSRYIGLDRGKVGADWHEHFCRVGRSKYMSKVTLARLLS